MFAESNRVSCKRQAVTAGEGLVCEQSQFWGELCSPVPTDSSVSQESGVQVRGKDGGGCGWEAGGNRSELVRVNERECVKEMWAGTLTAIKRSMPLRTSWEKSVY